MEIKISEVKGSGIEEKVINLDNAVDITINGITITETKTGLGIRTNLGSLVILTKAGNSAEVLDSYNITEL